MPQRLQYKREIIEHDIFLIQYKNGSTRYMVQHKKMYQEQRYFKTKTAKTLEEAREIRDNGQLLGELEAKVDTPRRDAVARLSREWQRRTGARVYCEKPTFRQQSRFG